MGRRFVVGLVALACLAVPGTAFGADVLPDLGMARIADIKADRLSNGHRILRYTTVITNTGRGPFEVWGQRSNTSDSEMSVTQRVFSDSGTSRDIATAARMYFAGDGHTHWHVRDLESSDLVRLDNGAKVGTWAKHGFCFSDNVAYRLSMSGAPQSPVYPGCGGPSDLSVRMGISVGWGDAYPAGLPDQYIDINGLGAGRYRLYVTADAQNWFLEADDSNNTTWVDLQLKGNAPPKIIGYGPSS